MRSSLFAIVLTITIFSSAAFSQATKPAEAKPAAPSAAPADAKPPAELPATAPVITIQGICNGKVPDNPPPDCKTFVTRDDFEKLVNALDPTMPPPRRQQLAEVYARMLVMSDLAEQRGLAQSPATAEVLKFMRMQTLGQLLMRDMQKEASNIPPSETEKFYNAHQQDYEQASFQRIFMPKTPPGGEKPPEEKTLLAEGEKIRAAAAAPGADFEKLQKQAYDDLGLKTPPPPTSAGILRRQSLPATQVKVFDLQPGQVSEVMNEPGGLYIFRLESKKKLSLEDVKPDINRQLEQERMRDSMEKVTKTIKPDLNPSYFGIGEAPPGAPGPEARPAPAPASSSKPATPSKPATKPPAAKPPTN